MPRIDIRSMFRTLAPSINSESSLTDSLALSLYLRRLAGQSGRCVLRYYVCELLGQCRGKVVYNDIICIILIIFYHIYIWIVLCENVGDHE